MLDVERLEQLAAEWEATHETGPTGDVYRWCAQDLRAVLAAACDPWEDVLPNA